MKNYIVEKNGKVIGNFEGYRGAMEAFNITCERSDPDKDLVRLVDKNGEILAEY